MGKLIWFDVYYTVTAQYNNLVAQSATDANLQPIQVVPFGPVAPFGGQMAEANANSVVGVNLYRSLKQTLLFVH